MAKKTDAQQPQQTTQQSTPPQQSSLMSRVLTWFAQSWLTILRLFNPSVPALSAPQAPAQRAESRMYVNTEAVVQADEVGPLNIEANYDGAETPRPPSRMPDNVTHFFGNSGAVIEAKKIEKLDLTTSYKKPSSSPGI